MEQGSASILFATGMAAIGGLIFSLLKAGDHIISSSFLFGNTVSLFNSFKRIGIMVDFVDSTEIKNVARAYRKETRLVFVETIANPITQIPDLDLIGEFCKTHNLIYVVDGTLTTAYSFLPKTVGASLSVTSLTKYIGGHGDSLGGSLTDLEIFPWGNYENIYDIYRKFPSEKQAITQIRKKGLRDMGATLSPHNAHSLSLGLETLPLRYAKQCENAQILANYLEAHPKIKKIHYPGLPSHPHYERQKKWFSFPGALLSFELIDTLDCLQFMDKLQIVISSSNLGDTRTLAIPVAKTIFYEIGPARRKEMGIDENLIRISVGIEDIEDLLEDFEQALN